MKTSPTLFKLFFTISLGLSLALPSAAANTAPGTSHAAAPTGKTGVQQMKEGEFGATVVGKNKEKLVVDKLDPPAAFNLEDIQNFPEDRLQPLLTSPVAFDEGRDFTRLMDFREEQPIHPWLPEIAHAPFLEMKSPPVEKAKEWSFSIIDQAGTTVSHQEGKGVPPAKIAWNGEDSQRGHIAVDTVYIPQLATVDKDGYHHTFMGTPIQFSSILYKDNGKTTIEISSKRLFQNNKGEFSKEGPLLLEKATDVIREDAHLPFSIQPYDTDADLGQRRQQALVQYFSGKLFIPRNQILTSSPRGSEKRGESISIVAGGAAQ